MGLKALARLCALLERHQLASIRRGPRPLRFGRDLPRIWSSPEISGIIPLFLSRKDD